jgi:hypothetical protein
VANSTQFNIYTNSARTDNVISTSFNAYNASSGDCVPNGGVIGRLTDVIVDIIDASSESFNTPLDNDQMDIFLMNDATIIRAMTMQGQGGFAIDQQNTIAKNLVPMINSDRGHSFNPQSNNQLVIKECWFFVIQFHFGDD